MYRTKDYILAAVLHCESETLSMLDKIDYDIADIMNEVLNFRGKLDLSEILDATYYQGLYEIDEYIDFLKKTFKEYEPEPKEEYKALQKLYPLGDFEGEFHNSGKYSIKIVENKDIYLEYLLDALYKFECDTGMIITK